VVFFADVEFFCAFEAIFLADSESFCAPEVTFVPSFAPFSLNPSLHS
jgi:hypothetical protein